MSEEVPVPAINLEKVVGRAVVLARAYGGYASSTPLTPAGTQMFRHAFLDRQADYRSERGLHLTLLQLEGRPLAVPAAVRLAWQLVGRRPELEGGKPIALFDRPSAHGWCGAEILGGTPGEWPGGKRAVTLSLWGITGGAAGFRFDKKVPEGWLRFLAYQLGYPRELDYPNDVTLLRGLRLWTYLVTAEEGNLEVLNTDVDARILKRNRDIIKLRHRDDLRREYVCPRGLAVECLRCTTSPHDCPASTQPRQYAVSGTPVCRSSDD